MWGSPTSMAGNDRTWVRRERCGVGTLLRGDLPQDPVVGGHARLPEKARGAVPAQGHHILYLIMSFVVYDMG